MSEDVVPDLPALASNQSPVSIGNLCTEKDRETFRRVMEEAEKNPEKYKDWCWQEL